MLVEHLKTLLATSYAFVVKAQGFHWNVEGAHFPEYHRFFGELYSEVYGNAIDQTAELVRQLDSYAPGSLGRMVELSKVAEQTKIPRAELMVSELHSDNAILLAMWKEAFKVAEEADEQGVADFIAGRIDAHGKHGWMLRSMLKKERQ